MKPALVELTELLREAREGGVPFRLAWGSCVHAVVTGRADGAAWREVLSDPLVTAAWRRGYERQPATGADRAAAVLAATARSDVADGPDLQRPCEGCGADLDALGLSRTARYCSQRCRRASAYARERSAA